MALTKETVYDKIEIISDLKQVHCRKATIVKEDGVELSRSFHRYVLAPSICRTDEDGDFVHTDTDISGEPQEVQDICTAVWSDEVKAAWKAHCEIEGPVNPSPE